MPASDQTSRKSASLWWIVSAPVVWVIHFLFSYVSAAIFCEKYADASGSAGEIQWAISIYTLIALAAIAVIAWLSSRHRSRPGQTRSHNQSSHDDQRRLIQRSTFLLSLLSAVATIFTALVVYFVGSCH